MIDKYGNIKLRGLLTVLGLLIILGSLIIPWPVIAEIGITCDPNEYDFGILRASENVSTGLDYFTCNNTGNTTIDVQISSDNMVGIIKVWNLSDTATPGDSTYGMKAGQPVSYVRIGFSGGDEQESLGFADEDEWETVGYIWEEGYMVIVKRNGPYNYLFIGLPPGGIFKWGLEFYSPTTNIGNEEMAGTVILTASLHT